VGFPDGRGKLDKVLLDAARRHGVDVREEHLVKRVIFDGERAVGVEYRTTRRAPPRRPIRLCQVDRRRLGPGALINHQLKDNWYNDPLLENKMAVFSQWKGDFEIKNTDDELTSSSACTGTGATGLVHPDRQGHPLPGRRPLAADGQGRGEDQVAGGDLLQLCHRHPLHQRHPEEPTLKTVEKFRLVKDYSYARSATTATTG